MSIDTLNLTLIVSMALGAIVVLLLIWDAQRAREANIAFQAFKRGEANEPSSGRPAEGHDQYGADPLATAISNDSFWSDRTRRLPAKPDRPNSSDKTPYSLIDLGKASLLTRGPPAETPPPKKPKARRRK